MINAYVNESGSRFVRDTLKDFPRPDRSAATAIREWGQKHGLQLNPDEVDAVTLHYQYDPERGWVGVVTQQMSLTQAVLSNWQGESDNNLVGAAFGAPWAGHFPGQISVVHALRTPGIIHYGAAYSVFNGLFRRSATGRYTAKNHVAIAAEDFQRFIWQLDFNSAYTAMLDRYWQRRQGEHAIASRINFVAACNKQVSEGSLSDHGRALAWRAAGILPAAGVHCRLLNIYGYVASDLLQVSDSSSGRTLLYVPGNASPLHEFDDHAGLQAWVASQCQDDERRAALQRHFALADAPDGLDFSGLDTALAGLAVWPQVHSLSANRPGFTTEGRWDPQEYVNYRSDHYNPPLHGDPFQALTARQRQLSYEDAAFLITSDAQVSKARWRGYLNTAMDLLAPLALVVPELAPLFALGGVAQFGLGLDQAINDKGLERRAAGVQASVFGLLNAAPLLHAGAERPALFRVRDERFVVPGRVNGQLGYAMGPVTPPHLPAAQIAEYFHLPAAVEPLPGADAAVAGAVIRTPRYDGTPDTLQASIDGYNTEVVYDLEHDAFVREDELNQLEPTLYYATTSARELLPAQGALREVSLATRMASLRALGIDLALPVTLPALAAERVRAIPKVISSIWVGDQVISQALLDNLAANAQKVQGTAYSYRLYLSNATPSAFAENLRLLHQQVPGLDVLPLEEQPLFALFRDSPDFAQYQAAIDGNGGVARNYASASDVLRYALLDHEGGLYMDIDDSLGAADTTGETLDSVALATTDDGLLLHPPMSNEKMSMNCLYNTSVIGSHPGNPTLKAIAEEMRERFKAHPAFYDHRPRLQDDPEGFYRYASELSRMTGPRLLTDVVDARLQNLRLLRQLTNLYTCPRRNAIVYVNLDQFIAALREQLPLNRLVRVGGNHSWAHT